MGGCDKLGEGGGGVKGKGWGGRGVSKKVSHGEGGTWMLGTLYFRSANLEVLK